MKTILSIIFITILAGCASPPSGEKFSGINVARPDRALVYIYRPNIYYAKGMTFPVLLDEEQIARIGSNGFFPIHVSPGTHSIRTETGDIDHDLSLNYSAATTTFLRLKINVRSPFCYCTSLEFESVDEETATADMREMREEVKRVTYQEQ